LAIRERASGTILFIGKIMNPVAKGANMKNEKIYDLMIILILLTGIALATVPDPVTRQPSVPYLMEPIGFALCRWRFSRRKSVAWFGQVQRSELESGLYTARKTEDCLH
jgi:hypothetical protein